MNFNKRGASPSVHMANALIPFFNSQIQGLNVLYKALTGKLPFDKRLKIQEKLITRGALMFGASLAYAAMMQDDEAYKNATPEQKYGNWFIRISGIDEPIKFTVEVAPPSIGKTKQNISIKLAPCQLAAKNIMRTIGKQIGDELTRMYYPPTQCSR
jgi:hypothetical protein